MGKLIVFDLDNTLADIGKMISADNIALLRELEEQGNVIAISSGKPTFYLCGLMRQIGLKNPVLIGENGAVIQVGVNLPPKEYCVLPYSDEAEKCISFLDKKIREELPDIWMQPNEVMLTPFPKSEREFEVIAECMEKYKKHIKDVIIYRHIDSYDVIPEGIDKGVGVKKCREMYHICADDTVAVGDSINDYPMFAYAGLALGVRVSEPDRVDLNFDSVTEALRYLTCMERGI